MNTAELADLVAYRHDLSKKSAREIVDSVLAIVTEATVTDREVSLSGFGKFKLRTLAARVGRNPRTGQRITIDPAVRVSFIPAKAFRERLARR